MIKLSKGFDVPNIIFSIFIIWLEVIRILEKNINGRRRVNYF